MYKKMIMGMVAIVIIATVVFSGCTNRNNTNQQAGTVSGLQTCAELNGYVCDESEECNETWLNAVDSFRCCSCECYLGIEEGGILSFDSFDETPANEDLGEVSP